jgi:hypothetical protein
MAAELNSGLLCSYSIVAIQAQRLQEATVPTLGAGRPRFPAQQLTGVWPWATGCHKYREWAGDPAGSDPNSSTLGSWFPVKPPLDFSIPLMSTAVLVGSDGPL